jgi:hypothetical protein
MTSDLGKLVDRFDSNMVKKLRGRDLEAKELDNIRKITNPTDEKTGAWTGRCDYCHSNDLWDDVSAYGCNTCSSVYSQ